MRKSQTTASYANWNNRRHKNPSPEDMKVNEGYAFTYNPEVQPLTPKFTLDLITWHNGMDNMYKSLKYCDITLYPELSQGSRWHYHGYIRLTDVMKFFIYDLPILRENGSYEIDILTDHEIWRKYVSKQENIMKDVCTEYGIPYRYESKKIMKVKIQPLQDTKFTELMKLCPTSEYIDE